MQNAKSTECLVPLLTPSLSTTNFQRFCRWAASLFSGLAEICRDKDSCFLKSTFSMHLVEWMTVTRSYPSSGNGLRKRPERGPSILLQVAMSSWLGSFGEQGIEWNTNNIEVEMVEDADKMLLKWSTGAWLSLNDGINITPIPKQATCITVLNTLGVFKCFDNLRSIWFRK